METVMRDYMQEAFLEVWNRTGKAYMTRAEIAQHFGKSAFWVQWMFVKSGAEPRTRAPSVVAREHTGIDQRLEHIESMAAKSAMNAAVKKLVKRTVEMEKSQPHHKTYIKKVMYLGKLIDTAQRHTESIREIDPDWKHIARAERVMKAAINVYFKVIKHVESRK